LEKEKRYVSTEENKAIFRRYTEEVGTRGNLELVDEIFDRYIAPQPDGSALERGPEDVKRFHREWRSAFPDIRIGVEDQVAEGDKVVSRITIRGTHQRAFRGMAPTGEEIELKGVSIFRFSPEGKVVESWDSYDQLSLMRQSIEQELRVARSIQRASLPKEVPRLEGWQISLLPARQGGRRRLLRVLGARRRKGELRRRGRYGQGRTRGLRDERDLRLARRRGHGLGRLSGEGTRAGQRGGADTYTSQHVRDLLLRHPRARER
jgi:hypothetical protein